MAGQRCFLQTLSLQFPWTSGFASCCFNAFYGGFPPHGSRSMEFSTRLGGRPIPLFSLGLRYSSLIFGGASTAGVT